MVMMYISFIVLKSSLARNRIAVSVNVPEVTPHVAIVFDCLSSEGIRRYIAVYFGVWYGWHHMTTSFNHINVQLVHPIRELVHKNIIT